MTQTPATPAYPTTEPGKQGFLMNGVRLWVVPAAAVLGLAAGIGVGTVVAPTPQACLDYIEHSGTAFGYAGDALTAASSFSISGIDRAAANMDRVQPDVMESMRECRGDR